jgi:hypothetical protein
LTGRAQLADLDATEELGKRQQAQLESAWTRAAVRDQWRHAAACQGIAGADLDALAAELLQTSAAECAEHNRMLRDAREALDEHTGIHRAMVMSDRLAEDADSVSGIDEVSQDMENAYPLLRAGGRPADENLLSLLQQGNRKPIDLEQAYAAALDQLAACRDRDRAGAREPGDDSADDESAAPATSEPIPF